MDCPLQEIRNSLLSTILGLNKHYTVKVICGDVISHILYISRGKLSASYPGSFTAGERVGMTNCTAS